MVITREELMLLHSEQMFIEGARAAVQAMGISDIVSLEMLEELWQRSQTRHDLEKFLIAHTFETLQRSTRRMDA